MSWKQILKQIILTALIPGTRPTEAEGRAAYRREQEEYYERRAEDDRMRYLMNPDSQQAPPTDRYR